MRGVLHQLMPDPTGMTYPWPDFTILGVQFTQRVPKVLFFVVVLVVVAGLAQLISAGVRAVAARFNASHTPPPDGGVESKEIRA